jgi:hypothetical protein
MLSTHLIRSEAEILSVWHKKLERGYPIPTLSRDEHLDGILPPLEKLAIYSRGRFGAWKYEVANQDHSCMQGVELVDHLLLDTPELTVSCPAKANAGVRRAAVTQSEPAAVGAGTK